MDDLHTDTIINRKFKGSLKAYFHDEFRNTSVPPYSISCINDINNVVIVHDLQYDIFNSLKR